MPTRSFANLLQDLFRPLRIRKLDVQVVDEDDEDAPEFRRLRLLRHDDALALGRFFKRDVGHGASTDDRDEIRDLLEHAVLVNLEVGGRQAWNEPSARVANEQVRGDDFSRRANRLGRLGFLGLRRQD